MPLRNSVAVDGSRRSDRVADSAASDDGATSPLPIGGGFKGYVPAILIEIPTGSLVEAS